MNDSERPAWIRFGSRVRQLRLGASRSQRDLAREIGIDFTYLSKLENGRAEPPADATIRRIAGALAAEPNDLLAAAGKVPTELRDLAGKDLRFAYLVNALPRFSQRQLKRVYAAAEIGEIPIPLDESEPSAPKRKGRSRR